MTKEEREVVRMALERLKEWVDHSDCLEDKQAITAIEKCLANDALEKKAENARELGLDYEPEKTVCPFCSSEWVTAEQHDRKMDRLEQKPVAWRLKSDTLDYGITSYDKEQVDRHIECGWRLVDVLYTIPPQRKPLSDEEIYKASTEAKMQEHYMGFHSGFIRFARAIEATHGIKGEA